MSLMDYGLALLSGVLLALSFPKFGHPAFAWIALVPLAHRAGRYVVCRTPASVP